MGTVPVAATVNVAFCPAVTVWLAGWLVIEGLTALARIVTAAPLVLVLPWLFVTSTVGLVGTWAYVSTLNANNIAARIAALKIVSLIFLVVCMKFSHFSPGPDF